MSAISISVVSFLLFLLFQAQGISTGDSGDLVTAAATFGVPHPPGYPLYTLMGWLVSGIPLYTEAWRVGLLSSIPHALVVGFVFAMVFTLTKQKISALFASILIAGNYLFFLYSVTPEVFALLDLFVISLIWLAMRRQFLLMSFVFGLALSHHHMIVFLIPALLYLVWPAKIVWGYVFAFFAGLLPYLYIVVAARGGAIVNWDHATTLVHFVRLLTRADYGTFQSGASIGSYPLQRLLQLHAMGSYFLLDFTIVGIFLFCIGLWSLWRRQRKTCIFFIIAMVLLGPLFFFYASFPITNRFTLATYERFMLPLYVMIAVGIGIGHAKILHMVPRRSQILALGVLVVSFLYPLVLGSMTIWRFWGLSTDKTAENFAEDIFVDVPEGSILALGRDTTLFTTQYVRYVRNFRPDTILIHGSFLGSPAYQQTFETIFPDLIMPTNKDNTFLSEFLIVNAAKHHIFSNIQYPIESGWHWVPHGLLFELFPQDSLPQLNTMEEENVVIWSKLHDPTKGILSRYNHLMLSDVRDVYAGARIELGRVLLKAGQAEHAKKQFEEAIHIGGDTQLADAYMYSGISSLLLDQCNEAIESFTRSSMSSFWVNRELVLYQGITYRDCFKDDERAKEFFSRYDTLRSESEEPLQEL